VCNDDVNELFHMGEASMVLPNTDFEAILNDDTKRFDGDIEWMEDEDHSPCREFRIEIQSEPGWPLFLRGRSYDRH
jgi:hypothetical protein